jgi:hypothetical protein
MRLEYLTAIAIAAFAAGAGLTVHSSNLLPRERQSMPAATQLANQLAGAEDPRLHGSDG